MLSELKKFSRPTIALICFSGIFLTVYTLRPLLWTGGTGISDTLDKIFWGDIKQSETVVSKTVETDKQGKTVKTIETIKYNDGKTIWDWLSLLGVPLSLAILGYFLQQQQQKRAEKLSKEQQERAEKLSKEQQERAEKLSEDQRKIADNETKEEVLQTYFDRLSVLLIDRNLIALSNKSNSSTITPEDQELLDSSLDVIRARTLSILRRFKNDAERKTSVIKFLVETEIVGKSKLNLQGAELQEVNLQGTKLQGAKLQEAKLQGAKLQLARLQGARLQWAELQKAELQEAELQEAELQEAELQEANLQFANLQKAKLQKAKLKGADLRGAELQEAKLQETNLQFAKLQGANLQFAELQGADLLIAELQEANLQFANLQFAKLKGADLQNIRWNSETVWPDKSAFINAENIPEKLKKELGITP
jgi:uncharacterized protein YjbI with pentapeptide repeats